MKRRCSFWLILCTLVTTLAIAKQTSHDTTAADSEDTLTRPDCLEVSVIDYNSAILYWNPHSSTERLNYVILCTGTYYEALTDGTFSPSMDFISRYVPVEMSQLDLHTLKPNCNYTCTVQAEGIGAGYPCRFVTDGQTHHVAGVGSFRNDKSSHFHAGYRKMMTSILVGGVLPMLVIVGCVGVIYLSRKYQSFQKKADELKKYQRTTAIGQSGGYPGSSSMYHTQYTVPPQYTMQSGVPSTCQAQNTSPSPYHTTPSAARSPYHTTQSATRSPYHTTWSTPPSPYQAHTRESAPYHTTQSSVTPLLNYTAQPTEAGTNHGLSPSMTQQQQEVDP